MKQRTVCLVGIGNFGRWWYKVLQTRDDLNVVVVDPDPAAVQRLDRHEPFYLSFDQALAFKRPEFILNCTPPAVHTRINHLAFDQRIPVLCEKPITEDYAEACEIVGRAMRESHLFMIAENYRRAPAMRKLRQLIEAGAVGEVTALYLHFAKEFFEDKAYLLAMPYPLLQDVSIHHLDAIRYIVGSEARRLFAWNFNPRFSRFHGKAAVNIQIEMENGVPVTYSGNLQARGKETDWLGAWRVEGTRGVLYLDENLHLSLSGETVPYVNSGKSSQELVLEDFLRALDTGQTPETLAVDYLKTQSLVHYAMKSSQIGKVVEVGSG
jgi:predicted dehydrogenase